MSITITLKGFDAKRMQPKLNDALKEASFLGVQVIRNNVIKSFKENKTGMWYVIRKGKKGPYVVPLRDANVRLNKKGVTVLNRKGVSNSKAAKKKIQAVTKFKGGRLHVASAPGQSPAVLFGNLARSVKSAARKRISTNGMIGANLTIINPYANALEYGKRNLAPRPYVRPAIEKSKKEIKQILINAIHKRFGEKT